MPPKKNENIAAPAKAPRKRKLKENPEKPKLKTPKIEKCKLASIQSFLSSAGNQNLRTPKIKQSPELSAAAQRKMDLANEVALAQLTKPKPKVKQTIGDKVKKKVAVKKVAKLKIADAEEKVVKKRGRPTKSKEQEATNKPTKEPVAVSKKKKAIGKTVPDSRTKNKTKRLKSSESETKIKTKKKNATNKRKADSTSTPQPAAKRKYVKKKVVIQPGAQNTAETIKTAKKGTIVSNSISTTAEQSPSILDAANKVLIDNMDPKPENPEDSNASHINSRKTSTSECPSWTKDISSSSTTTCLTVGSRDFVRIDKKLPVLKLSQINNEWRNVSDTKIQQANDTESESTSSDSSSSSSSSSDSESCRQSTARSLDLSSPSRSPLKSNATNESSIQGSVTTDEDFVYLLKKASESLQIDIEAISWTVCRNTVAIIEDKTFKLLNYENDVLKNCEKLNRLVNHKLEDNAKEIDNENSQNNEELVIEDDEPKSSTSKSDDDRNFTTSRSKYVMLDQARAEEEDPLQPRQAECEDIPVEDNFDNYGIDQSCNNDDDALSLFAESLTSIDSARLTNTADSVCGNASNFDEYIPQPLPSTQLSNTITYVPSKINIDEITQNRKIKTVCEKQTADSTSIYRETENNIPSNTQHTPIKTKPSAIAQATYTSSPKMISNFYRTLQGIRSVVFRGVCFFNLISKCKRIQCLYPHQQPNNVEISNRLSKLTDEMFIQEYMLLRNWPNLRRQYGMCYVTECVVRKMTRVLVEMVIDFISKAKQDCVKDAAIRINVTEKVLMYLNKVDLSECDDLLRYDFGKGILLCDVLIQGIGETQNFSRFKSVFVKLTIFISGIGNQFQLHVANQILERISILPCEEPLARAMLTIIKNTEPKIFDNPIMSQFEKQLSSLDLRLYGDLCLLREHVNTIRGQTADQAVQSPQFNPEMDHISFMYTDKEKRYTSPDTTKMDNLNKPPDDKPQTVKIIRPSIFNHNFDKSSNSLPSTSSSVEDNTPAKFRNWRSRGPIPKQNYGRNNMNNGRNMGMRFASPMHRAPRPPMLKQLINQRHVGLGIRPPKYPRRPGPPPDYI